MASRWASSCSNGALLGGEIAGDDERGRDQVGVGFAVDRGLPAVADDHPGVVLHGLGPVVHQVLIDAVGVDQ
jgi:hypothetical protein